MENRFLNKSFKFNLFMNAKNSASSLALNHLSMEEEMEKSLVIVSAILRDANPTRMKLIRTMTTLT